MSTQLIKSEITNLFATKTSEVLASFPSVFSKDDVYTLLTRINKEVDTILDETPITHTLTDGEDCYTFEEIKEAFEKIDVKDFCDTDYSSADYSLSGNEIYLESVDYNINTRDLFSSLEDELLSLESRNQNQNQ
jgi:hypothetical protein